MTVNRWPPPDLHDVASTDEVRRILGGISRARLSQIIGSHADFPESAELPAPGRGGTIRVWSREGVSEWQRARLHPRRRKRYVALTTYGRTGSIVTAAKAAGVHPSTVSRWTAAARRRRTASE
jgi:hypothetical protein